MSVAVATLSGSVAAGAQQSVTYTGQFVGLGSIPVPSRGLPINTVQLTVGDNGLTGMLSVGFDGDITDTNGNRTQICTSWRVDLRGQPVPITADSSGHQTAAATVAVSVTTRDGTCSSPAGQTDDVSSEQDQFQATITDSAVSGTLNVQGGDGAFSFTTSRQGAPTSSSGAGSAQPGSDRFDTALTSTDATEVFSRSSCNRAALTRWFAFHLSGGESDTGIQACDDLQATASRYHNVVASQFRNDDVQRAMNRVAILAAATDANGQHLLPTLRALMPVMAAMARQSDQPGGPPLTALNTLIHTAITLDTEILPPAPASATPPPSP